MPDELSWDEHELLARIAHRWYLDGRTQGAIADEFGLSRPKVQRLLERARSTGVVEIHVEPPLGVDLDLEGLLLESFALGEAIVSSRRPDAESQRAGVARGAARYLERRLNDGRSWRSATAATSARCPASSARRRRSTASSPAPWAARRSVDAPTNPNEICRALAEKCGGRAESLFAPAYVESVDFRDRLLEQDAVAHALHVAAQADVALVGVGGTDDDCTMVRSGSLSLEEIAELRTQGAVGRRARQLRRRGGHGHSRAARQPAHRPLDR